jgi:hypothetical protein
MTKRLGAEALVGNELEDGPGGTDPNALAAPGAARMIRVSVTSDDDLGVLAPEPHVEHPHLLDIFAGSNAAGTQDTSAHVVLDHHVAGTLVAGSQRQIVMGANRYVVLDDVSLELVAWVGASPISQMLARIALQQEIEHGAPVVHCRR